MNDAVSVSVWRARRQGVEQTREWLELCASERAKQAARHEALKAASRGILDEAHRRIVLSNRLLASGRTPYMRRLRAAHYYGAVRAE